MPAPGTQIAVYDDDGKPYLEGKVKSSDGTTIVVLVSMEKDIEGKYVFYSVPYKEAKIPVGFRIKMKSCCGRC